jgi:hypothetical protein
VWLQTTSAHKWWWAPGHLFHSRRKAGLTGSNKGGRIPEHTSTKAMQITPDNLTPAQELRDHIHLLLHCDKYPRETT